VPIRSLAAAPRRRSRRCARRWCKPGVLPLPTRSRYQREVTRRGGLLIAAWLLGCGGTEEPSLEASNPTFIADTSGLAWGWDCSDEEGYCRLSAPVAHWSGLGCVAPDLGYIFFFPGYLQLCLSCGTPAATPVNDCRYVACAVDDDCPQMTFYVRPWTYECVNNLCMSRESPEEPVSGANAENLCIAEWPRDSTTWFSEEYLALTMDLTEVCPDDAEPCEVPEECWPPARYTHPDPPHWDEDDEVVAFEP